MLEGGVWRSTGATSRSKYLSRASLFSSETISSLNNPFTFGHCPLLFIYLVFLYVISRQFLSSGKEASRVCCVMSLSDVIMSTFLVWPHRFFFLTIATSWLSSLVSHFFFFLFENFLIYLWHSLSSSHQIIACALAVHALRRVGREGSEWKRIKSNLLQSLFNVKLRFEIRKEREAQFSDALAGTHERAQESRFLHDSII